MDIVLKYEVVWQVLFSAELFRKSTVIFPEISGKIPPEISGNFRTHNPSYLYLLVREKNQEHLCGGFHELQLRSFAMWLEKNA